MNTQTANSAERFANAVQGHANQWSMKLEERIRSDCATAYALGYLQGAFGELLARHPEIGPTLDRMADNCGIIAAWRS